MTPHSRELADRLEALSQLESGWYANVGRKTGEQCCEAMRQAAALLRREPSVEEVARVIRENVSPAMAEAAVEAVAALWGREPG